MKKKRFTLKPKRNKSAEDKRLALLAQELGAAMMVVLVNDYGFSQAQADEALVKVIAQAKETRQMIATSTVVAAYDVLSREI